MKILAYKIKRDDEIIDNNLALSYLNKEEHLRYDKIKNKGAAGHFLVGRILMRRFMSSDLFDGEKKLRIAYEKKGKPYDIELRHRGVDFNLSHSGDWVVLVYGESDSLGIDIEKCRKIDMNVAEKYFCESECKYLNEESDDCLRDFFKLWTLKESYIKAIGEGLDLDLNSFGFCIKNGVKFYGNDIDRDFNFEFLNIDNEYELALCSKSINGYEVEIIKHLF